MLLVLGAEAWVVVVVSVSISVIDTDSTLVVVSVLAGCNEPDEAATPRP
jgi:hypothetical protein